MIPVIFVFSIFSSMKSAIHITLLLLWICALTVPSFLTVLNRDDNPELVINLNEEEPQEEAKNDVEEKQLIEHPSHLLLLPHLKKVTASDYCIISSSNLMNEIVLPPPETLV